MCWLLTQLAVAEEKNNPKHEEEPQTTVFALKTSIFLWLKNYTIGRREADET